MTDSVLANTRQGSFKSVPLLIKKIDTQEGANRAKYLFLNSSRRVQKPFGQFPPVFTVTGFTHALKGDEYKQKRDALRSVLSSETGGVFVHPFQGDVFCACDGKYKFTETFSKVNICSFNITFMKVDEDGASPTVLAGKAITPAGLAADSLAANQALQSAAASRFINSTPDNIEVSKSLFDNAGGSLKDTFAKIGDTIAQISDYVDTVLEIQEQTQFYVDNPLVGFAAIADGILGVDGLTTDVYAKFRTCQALFDWGNSGTDFDVNVSSPSHVNTSPLTIQDAEKLLNVESMKTFMQCAGCLEAYTQSGAINYANSDEIDAVIDIMEEQFNTIKDNITFDNSLPVNITQVDYSDFYDKLNTLRVNSLIFLAQQRTQAATIETITVSPIPASLLAYRLYGDSSRAEEILSINNLIDNMALSGDILVYSK